MLCLISPFFVCLILSNQLLLIVAMYLCLNNISLLLQEWNIHGEQRSGDLYCQGDGVEEAAQWKQRLWEDGPWEPTTLLTPSPQHLTPHHPMEMEAAETSFF